MSIEFLDFIIAIVIIIFCAKICGYISTRLGQPSVLGELIAGVLLGPTVLNIFHTVPMFATDERLAESIRIMAELGVLLLMFLAGLELDLTDLIKSGKVSALSGTLGVIIPFALGWVTALFFGVGNAEAVFIGLALSATSVSISAQTLMELNVLRSPVGLAMLGAAVFDDILVILMLSVTTLLIGGNGESGDIVVTILRMVAFLVGASIVGFFLLPRLTIWINRLPITQGTVAFVLGMVLIFAWSAEVLGGIAAITGAFLVGLFLSRLPFKDRLEQRVSVIAYAIFVPIFFVNIGLEANLRAISGEVWIFTIVLTVVAVLSKIFGCGLGGILSGFSRLNSLRLGIGMVSRGEVGLIVASFALTQSMMTDQNFSVIIFMVIVATVATPPLLRASYSSRFQSQPKLTQKETPN